MAERQMEEELQALKADIANLRADVADLAGTMQNMAGSRAHRFRDSLESELNEKREQLRRRFDEVRTRGRQQINDIEETVGQHPLGSLAAAVGIGFILAKMMDLGGRH